MEHHATLVRTSNRDGYIQTINTASILVQHEKLGIAEARTLTSNAQLRPAAGTEQVFVVSVGFVTLEAQNALLKLFEEPPVDTRFILVVPPGFQILPTLQSRIGVEHIWKEAEAPNKIWQAFVTASYPDRLQQIETWHKRTDKSPQWLQAMTAGVHSTSGRPLSPVAAGALALVAQKLATRGASNKMLLEHLALVLPLQK